MIELLNIKNFATVPSLEIEFGPHLNAVTGETGAGKSLIMGALQALLGERTEKGVIRSGEKNSEISAVLNLEAIDPERVAAIAEFLSDQGIESSDGQLVLRRVITPTSTRAYVNGTLVPLQVVRTLGDQLVEVHGPNDQQVLLQPRHQRELLDLFGNLGTTLETCRASWNALEAAREKLEQFEMSTVSDAELELLRYQLKEIDDAELDEAEESRLNDRHKLAANAQSLLEIATQSVNDLSGDDGATLDRLQTILSRLEHLAGVSPETGAPLVEQVETAISLLQDVNTELESLGSDLDIEPGELEQIEQRLGIIHRLKRKYARDIPELLEYADDIRARIDERDNFETTLRKLREHCELRKSELESACADLTAHRTTVAANLGIAITDKLKNLGFAQSLFQVRLAATDPGPAGADRVEFHFAPNPGEAPQPLRKIASSGEMARVMLAIKTVLSAADHTPILVFDEIDANVGGRTAAKVSDELAEVAKRHQVFCITHLPQVAAAATTHLMVAKNIESGRTITSIALLDKEARTHEISRMMGADAESETARRHAESMLNGAAT